MSYEPTEWKNGDIITAEKLNKIETELASKFLVVTIENGHLSRTWQEIYDALCAQRIPMIFGNPEGSNTFCRIVFITCAVGDSNGYKLFTDPNPALSNASWAATAPDEYPVSASQPT